MKEDEEESEQEEEEEIDIGEEVWIKKGDKDIVELFHSQSEISRKYLIEKIRDFDTWLDEREGLKDLPNVRMAIEIHQQIGNVINCLAKENRILSKIKNESIFHARIEEQKLETAHKNKVKKLEERIEKLKEKKEMKLKDHEIESFKRVDKEKSSQINEAKKLKIHKDTYNKKYAVWKKNRQKIDSVENPKENISEIQKP